MPELSGAARLAGAASPIIRLHEADNVVVARATLSQGAPVLEGVAAAERIPPGHKVATRSIAEGDAVRKYSQIIGFATRPIGPGEHVHVQNMGMGDFARDYAFGEGVKRIMGDDDYEFWIDVPAGGLPKLAFALLRNKYVNREGAVEEFRDFCKREGIEHQWMSWT